jgi:hypothetical protein
MFRIARCAALMLLLASPFAFAGNELMAPATEQAPTPQDGKAMVVFLRPAFMAGAISSTIYDAPDDQDVFLGSVGRKEKLAYQAEPGHHRFMVVAENADFLDADLEAGKTYYVLVKPRPGVWKARFSLIPIHAAADAEYSLQGEDFGKWNAATHFVEKTPAADAWYAEHKASVDEKKTGYLAKWNAMDPQDRAVLVLHPEDGVTAR